jgi:hypothetical protein
LDDKAMSCCGSLRRGGCILPLTSLLTGIDEVSECPFYSNLADNISSSSIGLPARVCFGPTSAARWWQSGAAAQGASRPLPGVPAKVR